MFGVYNQTVKIGFPLKRFTIDAPRHGFGLFSVSDTKPSLIRVCKPTNMTVYTPG